jgi:hypothetical protein
MDFIERPRDRELVRKASEILFKIPGVFSVGLGGKLVNGVRTSELAFSILVLEKKPLAMLAPHEIIPSEIEGLPTDVLESQPPRLIADEDEDDGFDPGVERDTGTYRPILGGIQIRPRVKPNEAPSAGTLGGFAKTVGSDAGQRVLLTNHHVLADKSGTLDGPSCTGCTKGADVGNPDLFNVVATILRGKNDNRVDAAIAVLNKNVEFDRDVLKDDAPEGREAIGESRPLETTDRNGRVHKRGIRTRLTYGIIGSVSDTSRDIEGTAPKENQIRIDLPQKVAGAGVVTFEANNRIFVPSLDFTAVKPNDVLFLSVPPNDGRYRIEEVIGRHRLALVSREPLPAEGSSQHGLIITPPSFGLKGDSGSLVLDDNGRVVGLLWAANSKVIIGNAWANRIEDVEDRLKIKIDSATTIRDTQVALVAPTDANGRLASRPGPRSGPGDRADEPLTPAAAAATGTAPPPVALRTLVEQDLLTIPRGREIYQLYFTHHMEVRELIDSNREVALVWHRQGGPGIIQHVLDAVRSRTSALPTAIRGRSWSDRVGAILAIFDRFGSSQLRKDVARFGGDLTSLGGATYPRFLEALKG